jgi:hypothetical protein
VLIVLVAQIGFWDTFASVLGALGVMLLLILLAAALIGLTGLYLFRRVSR